MKVMIGKRLRSVPRKKAIQMAEIFKDQVPLGIYAIEKGDYLELRKDRCSSKSAVKNLRRQYKAMGFKVYANGI